MKTLYNYIFEKTNFLVKKHISDNTQQSHTELKVGNKTTVTLVTGEYNDEFGESFEVEIIEKPKNQTGCTNCCLSKKWLYGGSICRPDDGADSKYGCKIIYPEQLDKYGIQDRPCLHNALFKSDVVLKIEK